MDESREAGPEGNVKKGKKKEKKNQTQNGGAGVKVEQT